MAAWRDRLTSCASSSCLLLAAWHYSGSGSWRLDQQSSFEVPNQIINDRNHNVNNNNNHNNNNFIIMLITTRLYSPRPRPRSNYLGSDSTSAPTPPAHRGGVSTSKSGCRAGVALGTVCLETAAPWDPHPEPKESLRNA